MIAHRGAISSSCGIAVIGGGIVGMSVAYGLAGLGHDVEILDEGDVAFRASRGNFALVWLQGKGVDLPAYARWTHQSVSAWDAFAAELEAASGVELSYQRTGGFTACLSEDELDRRCAALARLHNAAPDCAAFERLDHAEMKRRLPSIGRDVVGGTFGPHDGHVNSLRLFSSLHRAVLARGARYRPNAPTRAIVRDGEGFLVSSDAGSVRARRVVLAAGLGNAQLAPSIGLSAPVRPERGQILVTEKLAPFLSHPLATVRQTDEGGVMIGDSKEDVGFDTGNRHAVLGAIARRAVRIFPALAEAQIVRSWAALRVMSPDGHPIYDRSATHPGAYLVTCHSGVTLAAAHATRLARAIGEDAWDEELAQFGAARLAHVPTHH
jgi:glycine/D-amino acid oxidase-like deaminating enzyme